LCIYIDDTCTTDVPDHSTTDVPDHSTTDVPLMYQAMVHNTTHSFNNKITVYNDILCTFSLVTAKIYT